MDVGDARLTIRMGAVKGSYSSVNVDLVVDPDGAAKIHLFSMDQAGRKGVLVILDGNSWREFKQAVQKTHDTIQSMKAKNQIKRIG